MVNNSIRSVGSATAKPPIRYSSAAGQQPVRFREFCCLAIFLLVASRAHAAPPSPELSRFEYEQVEMGVPFRLALYAANETTANNAARAAYERIGELNRSMSDYDPESELMRLTRRSTPGEPVPVSPELFFVLQRSLALSHASEGAFDVTVGPVVGLWRRARRRNELPDPERLAQAKRRVGYCFLRLDEPARTVTLLQPGIRLDLGGIAKGYAADEALKVLQRHGISRAMVDGGGDIVVGDPPLGEPGWRIALEWPATTIFLKNAAVATSGDAYQHVEIDGTRYSHIIDPRTGDALTVASSVTVIAADGITADSFASAVSVLGPERGLALVERTCGVEAMIVQRPPETNEEPSQSPCRRSAIWTSSGLRISSTVTGQCAE